MLGHWRKAKGSVASGRMSQLEVLSQLSSQKLSSLEGPAEWCTSHAGTIPVQPTLSASFVPDIMCVKMVPRESHMIVEQGRL